MNNRYYLNIIFINLFANLNSLSRVGIEDVDKFNVNTTYNDINRCIDINYVIFTLGPFIVKGDNYTQ